MKGTKNTFQYYICKCQIYAGYGKTEKAFLNTPNYLLIDFEGYTKIGKHLNRKIVLTEYKLTNRGPNKYYLYAFITRNNEQYFFITSLASYSLQNLSTSSFKKSVISVPT